MSPTRPDYWQRNTHRDGNVAGSANSWIDNRFISVAIPLIGETVLRTRMQGQITLGCIGASSGLFPPDGWWSDIAVYCGLAVTVGDGGALDPPGVFTGRDDPVWIQWEQLYMNSAVMDGDVGFRRINLTYVIPGAGISDSKAKRGPMATDWGTVWLCWDFASIQQLWAETPGDFQGFLGGSISVSTLLEQAAG